MSAKLKGRLDAVRFADSSSAYVDSSFGAKDVVYVLQTLPRGVGILAANNPSQT